jgi:hypothetical protein
MGDKSFIKRNLEDLLIFNEAVEYFNKFNKKDFIFDQNINQLNPNQLRDDMINELNNLREIISNHPDLKFKKLSEYEKNVYYKFIKFYSVCPLCGGQNHYQNLKKFYFDEKNSHIKEKLIKLIDFENYRNRLKKININIGIPCCKCYKEIFENKK